MFTGIIEELGRVERIEKRANVTYLRIKAKSALDEVKVGESLAINGVCLTVIKKQQDTADFELIKDTSTISNLGALKINDQVNLERALRFQDRLSGHFVSGHIDGMAAIRRRFSQSGCLTLEIELSGKLLEFCIPKGSIAVDGVSLTIVKIRGNYITVVLTDYTAKKTTLGFRRAGDKVNIELDMLVKATRMKFYAK